MTLFKLGHLILWRHDLFLQQAVHISHNVLFSKSLIAQDYIIIDVHRELPTSTSSSLNKTAKLFSLNGVSYPLESLVK